MNLISWLSLFASISCLFLGIVVYSFNKKSILNKTFFLTSITAFVYGFTTVMMWTSTNFASADLWNKMGTIWPFLVALVLNFALIFTESNWIKKKRNYLILYLPAVSFWLIDLFTSLINGAPILEYWGYNDVASATGLYFASAIWTAALPLLAFVLCFRYYRKAKDNLQSQRRKYVAIGFAIPIAAFISTNVFAPSLNLNIPNLGFIATLFFSIFVGYSVVKHDLFTFDAALAAENILSTMPDSLILADLNGKILKVNERLVNFVGFTEEELMGEPIDKLCVVSYRNNCAKILRELSEKKVVINQELVFKTKAEVDRNVLFSGSIVKSKTGRAIGMTCIIHDVTEHKKLEERLVKAERFASIGELAGQVGHDLRNPLAGIKNGIYIIRKKNEQLTEEKRNEILGWIEAAIEDSNRIVTSLVDYSSELNLEPEPCTPRSLVLHALSKIQIPDRLSVLNHTTDNITMVADASKLASVFAGLIKNAVEAIPEKGSVEIMSSLKESNVEISFADSGIGIPENVLPKLFTPLVTTKAKGMGMSLAICRRVVEMHGGKVAVESVFGKGTTVSVLLPIELRV